MRVPAGMRGAAEPACHAWCQDMHANPHRTVGDNLVPWQLGIHEDEMGREAPKRGMLHPAKT